MLTENENDRLRRNYEKKMKGKTSNRRKDNKVRLENFAHIV